MLVELADALRNGLASLGLGSVFSRFLFGAALGFGGQLVLKPSISYRSDGSAKTFGETYVPWYVASIIPGIVFAFFV